MATKEILGTERKLRSDIESTLHDGLQRLRLSGSKSETWAARLDKLVKEDQEQVESIILSKQGLKTSDIN